MTLEQPIWRNTARACVVIAGAFCILVATMLGAMLQEHERGIGGWHAEWDTLPEIVCLCGSTRFFDTYIQEQWRLTLEGKIVFMIAICPPGGPKDHAGEAYGPEIAALLDELHLRKIDLADEVRILNVGGYIGKSTRRELEYAVSRGKRVTFLER